MASGGCFHLMQIITKYEVHVSLKTKYTGSSFTFGMALDIGCISVASLFGL